MTPNLIRAALLLSVSSIAAAISSPSLAAGVTLSIWHNTGDTAAALGLYEAYEKASGNTIELVDIPADTYNATIFAKWATGDRPDVIEWFGSMAFIDALNPSQNLMDLSDEEFVAKTSLYEAGGRGSDGNVYVAMTTFPEVWGLYYNKKLLEEAGLQPATTFAELQAQCAAFSEKGIATLNQAVGSLWPVHVMTLLYATTEAPEGWAQQLVNREVKISDEGSPYTEAYNAWTALRDANCFNSDMSTDTFEDSIAAVSSGEAVYDMIHSNMAPLYLDKFAGDGAALDETVGFTAFGGKTKKTAISMGPIGSFGIPKTGDAAKEEAALDFVRFITGEGYADYIQSSGTFPIIEGAPNPENPTGLQQAIKDAYDAGPLVALVAGSLPGSLPNVGDVMGSYIAGEIDAQKASEQLQQGMETAAQSMGLPGF